MYICNNHVYIYTGNKNHKITLDGTIVEGWFDIGESNDSSSTGEKYIHLAFADSLTFEGNNITNTVGFTTGLNKGTFYNWYGMYVDNNEDDSQNPNDYKWNYQKGPDANDTEYIYLLTKDKTSVPGINQESGVVKVYDNNN